MSFDIQKNHKFNPRGKRLKILCFCIKVVLAVDNVNVDLCSCSFITLKACQISYYVGSDLVDGHFNCSLLLSNFSDFHSGLSLESKHND